jgi:penicillin amidase
MVSVLRRLWGCLGPRRRGRWFLPGLKENVEVLTDAAGVPHVFADSLEDLYFVQGYLHARERAFQMDLQRRVGQGRLAEILGPVALPADRFLRKLGLWQRSLTMWPEVDRKIQSLLMTYAQGVNAGLQRLRPLECHLLGSRIEPWTGLHCLLWTQVMAFDMGSNWEAEWVRWELLQKMGPEQAHRFHLEQPQGYSPAMEGLWQEYQSARSVLDQWMSWGGGSNAWAVSPQRSAGGVAMLAADPHVLAKVPSTWYEVHLETPGLKLYGVSMPGTPGIVMGHNGDIAWGITNSYVDTQDLVLERLQGNQVLRPSGLVDMKVRQERIPIRGRPAHLETVYETEHGPILFDDGKGTAISMRWTGFSGHDTTLKAWFQLLECQTVKQAQQKLRGWKNPVLNFVLADRHGNIGYQLAGRVPVRRESYGLVPMAGWEEKGEWTGWVPPSRLPSAYNPECGYVVSANHAPQPLGQGPFLGLDFCDGYRAERITQLLQGNSLTAADMGRMQSDTLSLAALQAVELLRRDCGSHWPQPDLLQELLDWDGDLRADSRPAALYQTFLLNLTRQAYQQDLSEKLFLYWCGAPVSNLGVLGGQAGRYVSFVLRDWREAEQRDWPALAAAAWDQSLRQLEKLLGSDRQHWRWGRLHTFQPSHPLSSVPALAPLLNPFALELGGDVTTLLQSAVAPQAPFAVKGWVPSYRLVVEMGAQPRSASTLPTGQSGWVGDPMNFNHQALWAQGRLHPSLTQRDELERTRPERLILLARSRVS